MKRVIIISLAFISVLLIMQNTLRTEQQSVKVSGVVKIDGEPKIVGQSMVSSADASTQGSFIGSVNK